MSQLVANALFDRAKVCEVTTLSRATIDRKCKAGEFPMPIQISKRRVAWRAEDVLGWVASRSHVSSANG